jgi:hypothetical protein
VFCEAEPNVPGGIEWGGTRQIIYKSRTAKMQHLQMWPRWPEAAESPEQLHALALPDLAVPRHKTSRLPSLSYVRTENHLYAFGR